MNQLNSFDENIQFIFEMEEKNKIAFLHVMVITNTNDTISTTVYQKSTNTDIYINWHSHSPLQWKKITANVLIQRSIKICFNKKILDEELSIINHNLCKVNDYTRKSVQNISNHKRSSVVPNSNEGNSNKEIFINLKYVGQKGEQLMSKIKQIVSNSLEDDIKPKVVYNSVKLSQYFNIKDPVPPKCKSDLVYKCACRQVDCNES